MTNQERIIVSAYTGYLMCDFADVHKYVEEKLRRPVWTHELADPMIQQELHDAAKSDFLSLCGCGDDEKRKAGF